MEDGISCPDFSDSLSLNKFSILGGIVLYNHINAGLFYSAYDFNSKNNYYLKVLSVPMVSVCVGARYKNLYQLFDFSFNERTGFYQTDLGNDKSSVQYYGYNVWYSFLKEKKFLIKPLISLNIALVNKNYNFLSKDEWGGGSSYSDNFKDKSVAILFQMPVGIYMVRKKILISLMYHIPIYSLINGSYEDTEEDYFMSQLTYYKFLSENYKGNSNSTDYEKIKNVFSLRLVLIV